MGTIRKKWVVWWNRQSASADYKLLQEPLTPRERLSAAQMEFPLVVLAFLALTAGFIGIHKDILGSNPLHNFLAGTLVEEPEEIGFNFLPMLFSMVLALGGLGLGCVEAELGLLILLIGDGLLGHQPVHPLLGLDGVLEVGLGHRQPSLGLGQLEPDGLGVQLGQDLAGADPLAFLDQDAGDLAARLGGDADLAPGLQRPGVGQLFGDGLPGGRDSRHGRGHGGGRSRAGGSLGPRLAGRQGQDHGEEDQSGGA